MIFLDHILSADRISANPEKVHKVRDWPVPKNAKELNPIITGLFQNFAHMAKCLHQLVGPINIKKTKSK